jgi:hypothetical protein
VNTSHLIHITAVALTAAAGLGYLFAARTEWRRQPTSAAAPAAKPVNDGRWWWIAFAAQSAALLVSLIDTNHRSFAYGALATWAGVAAVLFAGRFLSASSRLLFALPLGALALLVAVAGTASLGAPPEDGAGSWISRVHLGFMAAHLAAIVAAGTGGGLYVLASARLKSADPRATRLPTLPVLERLIERGLIWGTSLLIGGLATGGAAVRVAESFHLFHPTAILGVMECILLFTVLAMHRTRKLSRRALAIAAACCLAVAVLATLSQVAFAHG